MFVHSVTRWQQPARCAVHPAVHFFNLTVACGLIRFDIDYTSSCVWSSFVLVHNWLTVSLREMRRADIDARLTRPLLKAHVSSPESIRCPVSGFS